MTLYGCSARATRAYMRMLDNLRLSTKFSWRVPLCWVEILTATWEPSEIATLRTKTAQIK